MQRGSDRQAMRHHHSFLRKTTQFKTRISQPAKVETKGFLWQATITRGVEKQKFQLESKVISDCNKDAQRGHQYNQGLKPYQNEQPKSAKHGN